MTGSLRWRMSGGLLRGTLSYSRRTWEYSSFCYAAFSYTAGHVVDTVAFVTRHSLVQQAHLVDKVAIVTRHSLVLRAHLVDSLTRQSLKQRAHLVDTVAFVTRILLYCGRTR